MDTHSTHPNRSTKLDDLKFVIINMYFGMCAIFNWVQNELAKNASATAKTIKVKEKMKTSFFISLFG